MNNAFTVGRFVYAALWERYERFKQKLWAVSPEDYEALLTEYREAAGI